jgi:predicted esterase
MGINLKLITAIVGTFAWFASAASAVQAGPPAPTVYDIPKLSNIAIDGGAGDWSDAGFRVDCLADSSDKYPAGFDSKFRLAWDERGLLAIFFVTDPAPFEGADDALWTGDSVELMLGAGIGSHDSVDVIVAPGRDALHPKLRQTVIDDRQTVTLQSAVANAQAARSVSGGGYVVEVLIPWNNLGINPQAGATVAVQACVNTPLPTGGGFQACWYPSNGSSDTRNAYLVRLSDHASPPVRVAAWGSFPYYRYTAVRVTSADPAAGFTAHWPGAAAAPGRLQQESQHFVGDVHLPLPPADQPDAPLQVRVGDQSAAPLLLGNFDQIRHEAFLREYISFKTYVFAGAQFPDCDFKNPNLVMDLIGPYTLHTTFYNADYQVVTTAAQPGRYGAIIDIQTADGKSYQRYASLFRAKKLPRPANGSAAANASCVHVTLPPDWGIDPDAAARESEQVDLYGQKQFFNGLHTDTDAAVLLSWLFELASNAPANESWHHAVLADQKWWFGLKQKLGLPTYRFLTYLPDGYATDQKMKWPLILFLHGAGERGDDVNVVARTGLPQWLTSQSDFPFVVISPQCPQNESWNPYAVNDFLDRIVSQYRVDPDRIYLTGLSMGGIGSWDLASLTPERFAAVAPISGRADPADIIDLRIVPLWVFHGAKDDVVPIEQDNQCVAALKRLGSDVKYTVYPDLRHDAWTRTYANVELYQWFLEHRRGEK